jgi:hypothetical protein
LPGSGRGKELPVALSDYERRVLAEIEVELSDALAPRRRRLRLVVMLVCCGLALAGVATVCALWLPAAAAAGLCSAAGLAGGLALGIGYERRRGL